MQLEETSCWSVMTTVAVVAVMTGRRYLTSVDAIAVLLLLLLLGQRQWRVEMVSSADGCRTGRST